MVQLLDFLSLLLSNPTLLPILICTNTPALRPIIFAPVCEELGGIDTGRKFDAEVEILLEILCCIIRYYVLSHAELWGGVK